MQPSRAITLVVLVGTITYYATGVMERVHDNRVTMGHVMPCAECVDSIAVLDRAYVGEIAYLIVDEEIIGPLLIVDCAAQQDYARLRARGLIGEVSRQMGTELGMRGPIAAKIVVIVGAQPRPP